MTRALQWPALVAACVCAGAVQAGTWTPARTLEGPFGVSSPPAAPLVAVNANGHTMVAWNETGVARYAERVKGSAWQASKTVPGSQAGANGVAMALGDNEVAAMAYATVATRYDPSRLMVSLRLPGGSFGTAFEPLPGVQPGDFRLAVACDGTVTMVFLDATGVWASQLAGVPGDAACNGLPGAGPWSAPQLLSNAHVGAALPELAQHASGAALVVWQEGAAGNPSSVGAARRPAGGSWQPPETISAPTARQTWNPKPVLDAAGNAAVGYLDGTSMVVVRRPVNGPWSAPVTISAKQSVYYPQLAGDDRGNLLAAWLSYDTSTGLYTLWQSQAPAGAAWAAPARLSQRGEAPDWPRAAVAADGSVAVVAWTDDNTNSTRAAVRAGSGGSWVRQSLGAGWWASEVPVGAGGGVAAAGWPQVVGGNPNSVVLIGRTWQ